MGRVEIKHSVKSYKIKCRGPISGSGRRCMITCTIISRAAALCIRHCVMGVWAPFRSARMINDSWSDEFHVKTDLRQPYLAH